MKHLVYVDGQEGTTGLRIHEMLARREDVEVLRIDPDKRKDPAERARLLNAAAVVFLCLPDAAAREAAAMVSNPNTCIIDASTAHRTAANWAFGLPELHPQQRARLRSTKRISNPGCHSTPFILLLRPLVDAGILPANLGVSATSITGFSGGGRKMIERYQAGGDTKLLAPRPYGLGLMHKHLPEMQVHSGLGVAPLFMPIVANFYNGLAVSVPLHLSTLRRAVDGAAVHAALVQRYADEPFVKVMPLSDPGLLEDGFFNVQACNGSNHCELFVFADPKRMVLMGRLDNLGKGASGAAVQTMNLILGLNETAGL